MMSVDQLAERPLGSPSEEPKRISPIGAILFSAFVLATGPGKAQAIETQTIPLASGWNLVALQVVPPDPSPAAVFGALESHFERAWTYDNESKTWSTYARPGMEQSAHNNLVPMGNIEVGRAYWVYMNTQYTWALNGLAPQTVPALQFSNGWNLVGIPTGTGSATDQVSMLSVLAAAGMDYDLILRWENGIYKKFTPSDTDIDDFTMFDASKGHWIRLKGTNSVTLRPTLLSSVRADMNAPPTNNYPSSEDLKLSDSPTPLGPTNQTHIVFLPGEESQQLAIANTGGGILLWDLQWAPQDATNVTWLQMSASRGVTTIENDVVQLSLDRTRLVKGTYRGTLTLRSTAGSRTFQVVANVTDLRGEWRGSAQIASVNGKKNQVSDIDLHLDFFEDPANPGLMRGLIDSRNSLLWPVDVPLIGYMKSASGNDFALGGGFVLPPGDQNNPPYDTFPDANDVDWNCNGSLDDLNPFPFPIYRSVMLEGSLTSAVSSPGGAVATNGFVIKGHYSEIVYGMLPVPILLEGTFSLNRESPVPFANRRPIANYESVDGTSPVVLKATNLNLTLPSGVVTQSFSFVTDLALQSLSVSVSCSNVAPSAVRLSLRSPDGRTLLLFDRENISALQSVTFPGSRPTKGDLAGFINSITTTRGIWSLIISNLGGTTGTLASWSLQLQGQPVFDVYGRVADSSGNGLAATVSLDGLPVSQVGAAASDGTFRFSRVPGLPMNLTANLPGYQPLNDSSPGIDASFTIPAFTNCASGGSALRAALAAKFRPLPVAPIPPTSVPGFDPSFGSISTPLQLHLKPWTNTGSALQVIASPSSGPAPLQTQLTLLPGTNAITPNTTVTWRFGDGASLTGINLLAITHTYAASSNFTVVCSAGSVTSSVVIEVFPSPHHSAFTNNFFQVSFTSGGTLPTNLLQQSLPGTPYLMVQHADCASFDIDRAPFTTATNRAFNADGLAASNLADNTGGFRGEDSSFQLAGDCADSADPTQYHPYPKPGCTGTRFHMLCNIGPQILPPPEALVYASSPSLVADPSLPSDISGQGGMASARGLVLSTGPLAAFWKH